MRCTRCKGAAVIEIRRHNAAYCKDCFLVVFRSQVERAIDDRRMMDRSERILVAVSGGKDSLALWDVLLGMGLEADGLYLGLGIGEYSDRSARVTRGFAEERGARLLTVDLAETYGFDIPTAGRKGGRSTCAVCGLSKRYVFNTAALDGGYDVIATGHNLDDEAAVLYGNVLRWDVEYLSRQLPVLPAGNGFPRKAKPLVRLTEREMAAWCIIRGIDYIVEECPLAAGNRHLGYKDSLNALEERAPGSKASFYLGFLERMAPLLGSRPGAEMLHACARCGAPTGAANDETCAFCRLTERAAAHTPVPVEAFVTRARRPKGSA